MEAGHTSETYVTDSMTVKPYVCHSIVAASHCPSGLNLILIVS